MNTIEPYTLSDAIRIGATLRPQTFNSWFFNGKSCAMGAAIEGLTGEFCDGIDLVSRERLDDLEEVLHRRYQPILKQRLECPHCPREREFLSDLIIHLNDTHKLTREVIADFVQSVEEQIGYVTLSESTADAVIAGESQFTRLAIR
jgi:hypothetical protein